MPSSVRRVAVITGSARNIGRATALDLARSGMAVMVHAREDREGVEETRRLLQEAGADAEAHLADITTEAGAKGLIEAAVARFGRLDVLVNNAALRRNTPFADITLDEWRQVFAVIMEGTFLCTRAAVPHMRANKYGRIDNVGGLAGHRGVIGRAHVAAAKVALAGFTRALAVELGGDGIVVNLVVPGMVDTQRGHAAGRRPGHILPEINLTGREGRPEEISHMIAMLCAENAGFTTGQTLHVSGGAYMP